MQRIVPGPALPLHTASATRTIEATLAGTLAPHTLMQRAGLATARLALAIAPHARNYWIACGPGNNGGDGLEAAMHLQQWGKTPLVSWLGTPAAPTDARASHARAMGAGVRFVDAPPEDCDICIDALLGTGANRAPEGRLADWIAHINTLGVPVLAVDLPSGLNADTGATLGPGVRASHTLSLLTLKPGLYTAQGRDQTGEVWHESLGADVAATVPQANLGGAPAAAARRHATHKGSYGDVAVIGGASGMSGAALLAASAALHHGAGRVYVGLLDEGGMTVDPMHPELMFREPAALDVAAGAVVAGCGGGPAMAAQLPRLLSIAPRLVLDADALNSIANDSQLATLLRARTARQRQTVLTPHPLEAARLLACTTAAVQADRLAAAQQLARQFGCVIVLKGSGTVVAAPDHPPVINPTGNAHLATPGTGDVLAGLIGARLAHGESAFDAACAAVWLHGLTADTWPRDQPLTASALAQAIV